MKKSVEDICSLLISQSSCDELCQKSEMGSAFLQSNIGCETSNILLENSPFLNMDFANIKVKRIENELLTALKNNCAEEVKCLKEKYKDTKEFIQAKKILNDKCKELWSVYSSVNAPKQAMRALGITNKPDIDTIIGNNIKYFEKDNSENSAYIIASILNNKNLDYTMEDIHNYLKNMYQKEKCCYNFKTVKYLIAKQNYSCEKLFELGVSVKTIKKALALIPAKECIKNLSILKLIFKIKILLLAKL